MRSPFSRRSRKNADENSGEPPASTNNNAQAEPGNGVKVSNENATAEQAAPKAPASGDSAGGKSSSGEAVTVVTTAPVSVQVETASASSDSGKQSSGRSGQSNEQGGGNNESGGGGGRPPRQRNNRQRNNRQRNRNQNQNANDGDDDNNNRGGRRRRNMGRYGRNDRPEKGNRADANSQYDDPIPEDVPEDPAPPLPLSELKDKTATELLKLAQEMGVENTARSRKPDLVFQIMRAFAKKGRRMDCSGVLETMQDGYGFLRTADSSYLAGPDDIYISPSQIRKFSLRTGDTIVGRVRPPKEGERYFALAQVETINFEPPENSKNKVLFENLTPLFPNERYSMERGNGTTEDISSRILDIIAPFGKGQRGLIVSPPKAGKTMLMQNIAQSLTDNFPEAYLMVLLIDERPEEVTDMQRSVRGEVIASTFDEPPARHVQVAEMAIEKAKRLVEHKRDVIILLDSITRLARAHNTVAPTSGRVLTGGVDANALQKPKRFFGAARNIEEGGSLTIIATALVETGSKMDEVIYEEFKGTGNMEVQLERRIAEKRVFPAININRSGTRREELMLDPADLQRIWVLRKLLHSMDEIAAVELLIDRMKQSKTNSDFFDSMKRQ